MLLRQVDEPELLRPFVTFNRKILLFKLVALLVLEDDTPLLSISSRRGNGDRKTNLITEKHRLARVHRGDGDIERLNRTTNNHRTHFNTIAAKTTGDGFNASVAVMPSVGENEDSSDFLRRYVLDDKLEGLGKVGYGPEHLL